MVRNASAVSSGDALTIEFHDGKIGAVAAGGAARAEAEAGDASRKPPTQESLF